MSSIKWTADKMVAHTKYPNIIYKIFYLSCLLSFFCFNTCVHAQEAIYSMNESEQHIASLLLMNSLSNYLDEEVNISLGNSLISESDLVEAFRNDTWNAVDYFLGTKVRLSGKISRIGVTAKKQSYVQLITPRSFASFHLLMAINEVAPSVKRGTQVSFYCSIEQQNVGMVAIFDCYTRDRAELLVNVEHMKQLDQFLKGGNPANSTIPYATLWSILANQYLPKESVCFDVKSRNYRACATDIKNLDEAQIKPELNRLFKRLKARGLKI